ncbi:MAG: YitT family protein [Bacteroidales bacterium]|nr:YitT family protein [Bacteroidales bacterium]MBO7480399.1 YitT family protein [Bacteroidales bacterium]MBO7488284.1 YitT family protein [Bacteroidales bacterium]
MLTQRTFWTAVKEYTIIFLGLLLYVSAWSVFLLPNNMVGGGVSGLGAIIQYATGFKISYTYFIVNAVLLAVALKILGRSFGAKTIFAVIVTTILFRVMPGVIPSDFINEFAHENGRLTCALFGGALSGIGIAITFTQGGSSGGTDIIALIINKYRSISPGSIIVAIDVLIISSTLLIPSAGTFGTRLATVIYGFVTSAVFSYTLDLFLNGNKQCVQIMVFSRKYAAIADAITQEAHRGVTAIHSEGWYTHTESEIVTVVARKQESSQILKIIKKVDDTAFVSVNNVSGVFGKGFEQIKK